MPGIQRVDNAPIALELFASGSERTASAQRHVYVGIDAAWPTFVVATMATPDECRYVASLYLM